MRNHHVSHEDAGTPTQDEVEALYARVVQFIPRLRNSQSPSLNVRARLQCQHLQTHYALPLTGVNELTFDWQLASDLETTFQGALIKTQPTPDGAQVQYVLMIPWECATSGRAQRKVRLAAGYRYAPPPPVVPSEGGFEKPLLMLMFLVVTGLVGYVVMFK